jgi:hypothetical protein
VIPLVHFALVILEMGVFLQNICLEWPWIPILPISASQVAGIIGMSHWCLDRTWFL